MGVIQYVKRLTLGLVVTGVLWVAWGAARAARLNGFVIDNASVPKDLIVGGGPPRDGIPALTDPRMLRPDEATYLYPDDVVLGVDDNGVAKAYPTRILVWHEIVNDTCAGDPVVITFCPLCGTGVAFSGRLGNRKLQFGVSGLLYNSNLLMYDRRTESLWPQISGEAISGPLKGRKLTRLPLIQTTWHNWLSDHPSTLVLSLKTGYRRDYDHNPYGGYDKSPGIYFRVRHQSGRYPPKEKVLGLYSEGRARAWPFAELKQTSGRIVDQFRGKPVTILYDRKNDTARALGPDGKTLPAVTAYWFAWYAFFPYTEVYEAGSGSSR